MPAARNEVFNVGADTPYSILQLAEEVAKALDVEPRVEHLPARNEVVHAFSDHEKARRVFAPPPPLPLDEGLARTMAWVREHGVRPPVDFPGEIEIHDRLPPSWARLP